MSETPLREQQRVKLREIQMTSSVIGNQLIAQHWNHYKFFLECKDLPMLCNVSLWKIPVSDWASASAMNTPFADAPSHYYGTLFWSRKK